ncbi:uncharacterized protein LOC112203452 [Rosa chinensis]|uniref:uncharacterized protein LOC112203452 n=1 Tax=Rosa chinensis TaxID=74649 RepID=UPI000D094429|nr:uncharacterized protein LOC112203452 [Rosa chinensis]
MDKSWVHLDRRSPEYYASLKVFLDGAPKSYPGNEIVCPCTRCKNRESFDRRTVEQHLVVKGMWPFYMNTRWKEHGESYAEYRDKMELQNSGGADIEGMQEFLNETFVQPTIGENVGLSSQPHIFEGPTPEAEKFYKLLEDANKEVYPGCKKFKKLEAVVRLYQLKCLGGLSDNIFSKLLEFIKELLPEGECLPDSFYQTKKLINELGLKYEKIDACPNDCMLFWKDRANLKVCSQCGTSRYIQKESEKSSTPVSAKVLRYFPLTPRLQRLYMSKHTALDMRWHATECPKDGFMRHPSDSPAWKQLDLLYPEFGSESRNVRLGLASDGFNPFGNMSTAHSTWPVVLSVYNLPPWMCMKQSNLFLTLLIPGPRGPGNDMDVYLEPLIDELKELWGVGANTYDVSSNERFTMKAALLWTINDFPAYGNLSGWSTKGFKACPHCMNETDSKHLKMSHKICYLGHRRFLPIEHRFRRLKAVFNGYGEDRVAPKQLTGMQCLAELSNLSFTFGKPLKRGVGQKRQGASTSASLRTTSRANRDNIQWKKKSTFFQLPYWKNLLIRHNLDVMHIEKNISDSILGTLLAINGKTKDGINARADLELMKIRKKNNILSEKEVRLSYLLHHSPRVKMKRL